MSKKTPENSNFETSRAVWGDLAKAEIGQREITGKGSLKDMDYADVRRVLTHLTGYQMDPLVFRRPLAAQRAFELMRDGWSSLELLNDSAKYVKSLVGRHLDTQFQTSHSIVNF